MDTPEDSFLHAFPRAGPARYRLTGRSLEEPSNRLPREMAIASGGYASGGTKPGLQVRSKAFFGCHRSAGTISLSINCNSFEMHSLFMLVRCSYASSFRAS